MARLNSIEVRHPTLVDRVVEHVFERIVRRELQPGQRVTEEELAVEFGVSRTPVREAVKRLADMGVVVIFPRARLEVAPVQAEDFCQITQLREDLECLALTLALPRMSEENVGELGKLAGRCQELAERGSRLETFRADSEFHLAIAAMSGNAYLLEALRRLDVKVLLCRVMLCLSEEKIRDSVRFHLELLEAMGRREVEEACALMRQHVRGTL